MQHGGSLEFWYCSTGRFPRSLQYFQLHKTGFSPEHNACVSCSYLLYAWPCQRQHMGSCSLPPNTLLREKRCKWKLLSILTCMLLLVYLYSVLCQPDLQPLHQGWHQEHDPWWSDDSERSSCVLRICWSCQRCSI